MYIILCFGLILLCVFFQKWFLLEGFVNIPENIGNHLAVYVHEYTLSLCEEKDFTFKSTDSKFLKELPTHIPFRKDLADQLKKNHVTLEKVRSIEGSALWECTSDMNMILFQILKPTIHDILDKALIQSGLKRDPLSTVIHFRCADTPFVKHPSYFLQKYSFFKESLEKINVIDKKVTLMNCSTHLSKQEEQDACASYVKHLSGYLESIGYQVSIRCKTNVEDFADLFYAKAVISTGGSYSFMSGFFGKGLFLSTEHILNGNTCTTNECNDIFIRGHNIFHEEVESYYHVDKVYTLLSVS